MKQAGKSREEPKKKGGFVYRKRSAETVKAQANQKGGNFDSILKAGFDSWRPKQGDNEIRILPPTWEDPNHYGYKVWVHRRIGSTNSTYLCPLKMEVEDSCPICDAAKEASDGGEKEEAKALQAAAQYVYWILDRDDKKPAPVLYVAPWTIDRDIAILCQDKKTGKTLFIDRPDDGYDVSFTRTGKDKLTKYIGFKVARESSPIDDDQEQQDEFLEFIEENKIPDLLRFYDADYLEKQLAGTSPDKDEDVDEEEAPKKKRRAAADDEDEEEPAPKKKRRAEPEDEEEEPAPKKRRAPVEDDEEEEAPKKTARVRDEKKSKRVVEEDEEEEPAPKKRRAAAEDDEEEEAPKKTRRRGNDDDEEEEPAPKKRRAAADDDEEEEPAPKKRRAPVEDDDEEEAPPKKKRVAAAEEDEEEEEAPPRKSTRR